MKLVYDIISLITMKVICHYSGTDIIAERGFLIPGERVWVAHSSEEVLSMLTEPNGPSPIVPAEFPTHEVQSLLDSSSATASRRL